MMFYKFVCVMKEPPIGELLGGANVQTLCKMVLVCNMRDSAGRKELEREFFLWVVPIMCK